jgi:hypothetical protein
MYVWGNQLVNTSIKIVAYQAEGGRMGVER